MSKSKELLQILQGNDYKKIRHVFLFDSTNRDDEILLKFRLWAKFFKSSFFEFDDAPFHHEMDKYNLQCYRDKFEFINIAYRGAAKTARTKLFIAYVIANDLDHTRKYFKVISHEPDNSTQIVTDTYNTYVQRRFKMIYPDIFAKSDTKKEERMGSFTTSTGVKMVASTVGKSQRGALQDDSRPDFILFDDFEDKKSLRSSVITKAIWDNMEEARQSLSTDGSCVYCCNYISESGNIHKLVTAGEHKNRKLLITPIVDENGQPTWESKDTLKSIEYMREYDDDFEGEKMCNPRASKDIYFDRNAIERQGSMLPIKTIAGFKIFYEYNPSHEYASGHDISGGVGLDSSTSVFIDFSCIPAQVVATFKNDSTKPDTFGYEIQREVEMYGNCLAGIEQNNHGHATIAICKQLEVNMYERQGKAVKKDNNDSTEYGWQTNSLTKPKMMSDLFKAIRDGLLIVNDIDIINEIKGYTRNDLLEFVKDPSLTTRHFDLLIATAIAWQMKDFRLPSASRFKRQSSSQQRKRQSYKSMTKYGG